LVMCLSSPAISTPSTEHHSKNYIANLIYV
jgi:hypothetical protein